MNKADPLCKLLDVKVARGGISALLLVPDPGEISVDVERATDVMPHLLLILNAIMGRQQDFGTRAGENQALTGEESHDWSEAYRKVVAFVVCLLRDKQLRERMLTGDPSEAPFVRFMRLVGSPEEAGVTDNVKLERLLLFNLFMGLAMSKLMAIDDDNLRAISPIRFDLELFKNISQLTSLASASKRLAYSGAAVDIANCLSSAAAHYGRLGEQREQAQMQATARSILRLPEFPLLAARAPHLLKKYGLKTVEERFEQQLSLALQSFGFRTVPTTRGGRRGDNICITGGDSPAAILVEAKTSEHPYNLPTKDERALLEYARKLDNPSPIIFPLRLILIVGPNPDVKLAERLNRLEAAARVPVRYCSAAALAALLRQPPTGVTAEGLFEAFGGDQRIISTDQLVSISSKAQERLTALRNWINTTLR
jgi:hypothetical protein